MAGVTLLTAAQVEWPVSQGICAGGVACLEEAGDSHASSLFFSFLMIL